MRNLTRHLYFWVLLAIVAGGTIGYARPEWGVALKPLGDGFIALVKMLISPIIFCTVALGIAGAGDMKKVGRVGGKALLYFEVVSTFALVIGLIVGNVIRPGAASTWTLPRSMRGRWPATPRWQRAIARWTFCRCHPRTFFDAFTGTGDAAGALRGGALRLRDDDMGKKGNIVDEVIATSSKVFSG